MDNLTRMFCPMCISTANPGDLSRWKILAHMAVDAAKQGERYREALFARYLQSAYEKGIKDSKAKEALE